MNACRAVVAFRIWLHEKAGGDVGWAHGAKSADLPPKRTRDQLISRWDRHTKDCNSCKTVSLALDTFAELTCSSAKMFSSGTDMLPESSCFPWIKVCLSFAAATAAVPSVAFTVLSKLV